jgi:hypothetical protein
MASWIARVTAREEIVAAEIASMAPRESSLDRAT